MSGIPAPLAADDQQAVEAMKNLLTAALKRLHLELTSAPNIPVGRPVTASIKGLSLELDVSDLLEGVIDAGWVTYVGATIQSAVQEADAGLTGTTQSGVDAIRDKVSRAIEDVPPPSAAASRIPGLAPSILTRIMALTQIPRLRVRVDVQWHLRDGHGKDLVDGKDFLAPNGLTHPDVTFIIPPLFQELTLDTLTANVTDHGSKINACTYYLSVTVTLSFLDVWASWELPTAPPYVASPAITSGQGGWSPPAPKPQFGIPLVALPLLYPTVVALFSATAGNLSTACEGELPLRALVVVPHNSPIGSLEHLNRILKTIDQTVANLRDLASVVSALVGLDLLSEALQILSSQPAVRLVKAEPTNADPNYPPEKLGGPPKDLKQLPVLPWNTSYPQGVPDFSEIEYFCIPNRIWGVIPDGKTTVDFDDVARSAIMLGLPGTKVRFLNDQHYEDGQGSWTIEIPTTIDSSHPLDAHALLPFVIVRDIPALPRDREWPDKSSVPPPATIPPERSSVQKDEPDGWGNSMSSMYFEQPALTVTCAGIRPPANASLTITCPPRDIPAGKSFSVSGALDPALPAERIRMTYYFGFTPTVTQDTQTDDQGQFTDTVTLPPAGSSLPLPGVWFVEAALIGPDDVVLVKSNACELDVFDDRIP